MPKTLKIRSNSAWLEIMRSHNLPLFPHEINHTSLTHHILLNDYDSVLLYHRSFSDHVVSDHNLLITYAYYENTFLMRELSNNRISL